MSERQKLTVLEVKEPVKVGDKGAEKMQFRASDASGKEVWYFTFKKDLFGVIRQNKDKTIEVDVDVSEREYQGNTFVDRKVSQVYIEGQPIVTKDREGWSSSRSPEERAAIAAQVAVKAVTELWVAGKLDEASPFVIALKKWLIEHLGIEVEVESSAPSPMPSEVRKVLPPTQRQQADQFRELIKSRGYEPSEIAPWFGTTTLNEWLKQGHSIDEAVAIIMSHPPKVKEDKLL